MKNMFRTFGCLMVLAVMTAIPALAGRVSIAPQSTAVTSVEGTTRAALKFNASAFEGIDFESGRGVYLEWTLSGVPPNSQSEYLLFEAGAVWQDGTGVGALLLGGESYAIWDIEPIDYERAGGFVRFDLTSLVQGWLENGATNHGVVITTTALSAQALLGQLENARLVLR